MLRRSRSLRVNILPLIRPRTLFIILFGSIGVLSLPLVLAWVLTNIVPPILNFLGRVAVFGLLSFALSKSVQLFLVTRNGELLKQYMRSKLIALKKLVSADLKSSASSLFTTVFKLALNITIHHLSALGIYLFELIKTVVSMGVVSKASPYVVVGTTFISFAMYQLTSLLGVFHAIFTAVIGEIARWMMLFMLSMTTTFLNIAANVVLFIMSTAISLAIKVISLALQLAFYVLLNTYYVGYSLGFSIFADLMILGVVFYCAANAHKITWDGVVDSLRQYRLGNWLYENGVSLVEISKAASLRIFDFVVDVKRSTVAWLHRIGILKERNVLEALVQPDTEVVRGAAVAGEGIAPVAVAPALPNAVVEAPILTWRTDIVEGYKAVNVNYGEAIRGRAREDGQILGHAVGSMIAWGLGRAVEDEQVAGAQEVKGHDAGVGVNPRMRHIAFAALGRAH